MTWNSSDEQITCVVPTYNRPILLDRCLKSIAIQTSKPKLVIVAENGMDTSTKAVVEKYSNLGLPIEHHASKEFIPAWDNWMNGLSRVRTSLTKIVWDDDWLEPNCLEQLLEWRKAHNASIVLCAAFGHINSEKFNWYCNTPEINTSNILDILEIITRRMIPNSPLAGLHETQDVIDAMRYSSYPKNAITPNLIFGVDYAINIWALLKGRSLYFNPTQLVNMYSDGTNMTEMNQNRIAEIYKSTVKKLVIENSPKIDLKNRIILESMKGNRKSVLNILAGEYVKYRK